MNFQTIPPVPDSRHLLDLAFRRARKKSQLKKFEKKDSRSQRKDSYSQSFKDRKLQFIKKTEFIKLDVIKGILISRLDEILQTFPEEKKLPSFYAKLLRLTLDYFQFKKSFGAVNWATGRIWFFHQEYLRKASRARDIKSIKDSSRQFYGRVSSVLKQIDGNLQYLEQSRKILCTYPDIKEMPTVCIYGFPNVGKSTLLNKLCGSKAKVAGYPFTTLTINAGYTTIKSKGMQFLDVPGTLAREEKKSNIELMAELAVEELAGVIIYVFDLSGYCGYSVREQEELFRKIRKGKTVLAYLAKKDLTDEETLKGFRHRHYSLEELKEELGREEHWPPAA